MLGFVLLLLLLSCSEWPSELATDRSVPVFACRAMQYQDQQHQQDQDQQRSQRDHHRHHHHHHQQQQQQRQTRRKKRHAKTNNKAGEVIRTRHRASNQNQKNKSQQQQQEEEQEQQQQEQEQQQQQQYVLSSKLLRFIQKHKSTDCGNDAANEILNGKRSKSCKLVEWLKYRMGAEFDGISIRKATSKNKADQKADQACTSASTAKGMGIFATRDFQPNEIIAKVPIEACLIDSDFGQARHALPSPMMRVAFALLQQVCICDMDDEDEDDGEKKLLPSATDVRKADIALKSGLSGAVGEEESKISSSSSSSSSVQSQSAQGRQFQKYGNFSRAMWLASLPWGYMLHPVGGALPHGASEDLRNSDHASVFRDQFHYCRRKLARFLEDNKLSCGDLASALAIAQSRSFAGRGLNEPKCSLMTLTPGIDFANHDGSPNAFVETLPISRILSAEERAKELALRNRIRQILDAITENDTEMIQNAVARGCNVGGMTVIMLAAVHPMGGWVLEMFGTEHKINEPCSRSLFDIQNLLGIKLSLKPFISGNAVDKDVAHRDIGHTPLMLAYVFGVPSVIGILLRLGADVHAKTLDGHVVSEFTGFTDSPLELTMALESAKQIRDRKEENYPESPKLSPPGSQDVLSALIKRSKLKSARKRKSKKPIDFSIFSKSTKVHRKFLRVVHSLESKKFDAPKKHWYFSKRGSDNFDDPQPKKDLGRLDKLGPLQLKGTIAEVRLVARCMGIRTGNEITIHYGPLPLTNFVLNYGFMPQQSEMRLKDPDPPPPDKTEMVID